MAAVAPYLLHRGGDALLGDRAVRAEFVVGDGFGDRDVAMHEHAQLVTDVQVHRVERLDVQPQGVEAGVLRGPHLGLGFGP